MAKEWAKQFYNSRAWLDCRRSYITKVQGLCERCLKRGKVTPGKILHHTNHLTPENINNYQISLNHDNLEFVCQDCHNEEHIADSVTADGLIFVDGELVKR